jgi:integrase
MSSLVKRNKIWHFKFKDEHGVWRQRKGCTDRGETQRMANAAETRAAQIRAGMIDPAELRRQEQDARSIEEHLSDYRAHQLAKGATAKHADRTHFMARRVLELAGVARLSGVTAEAVQKALGAVRETGVSLATVNHHRTAVKSFMRWARKHDRTAVSIDAVEGFKAKTDRRHDRRTISLAELQRLIAATAGGPDWRKMTGRARALCYRLAAQTGLRYSEIMAVRPESIDWTTNVVRVPAAYTKNRELAELTLTPELAVDLNAFAAGVKPGDPLFMLSKGCGAEMLRADLARAGIPYRDGRGLVYDFHALRCQHATLLDLANVSPGVIQRKMRHSTLELTAGYIRHRDDDLERATAALPELINDDPGPNLVHSRGTSGRNESEPVGVTCSDVEPSMMALTAQIPGLPQSEAVAKQMPKVGLEPTRVLPQRILNPSRLPFRHFGPVGSSMRRPRLAVKCGGLRDVCNRPTGAR